MASPARSIAATAQAALPAAVLVGVALWAMVRTCHAPASVPDDAAWQRAATAVRSHFQPGDLIVFAPAWIDPVGRNHLGDLIPLDAAGRLDAARFPTIWQVSIRNATNPDVAGATARDTQVFDGVTVTRFEQPKITVTADAVALLPTAKAAGPIARGPSLEMAEVGFTPHRCVQVAPQPNGSVRITYPGMLLGTTLVAGVGLADIFTRRDVRAPGKLEIEIGGAVVATAQFGVDDGWVKLQAATQPGAADVTFIATAVGSNARDRLICFAAEARQ